VGQRHECRSYSARGYDLYIKKDGQWLWAGNGYAKDDTPGVRTEVPLLSESGNKLRVLCETNDGFEIAEADLKLRGPGDLEGTQQSGIAFNLRLANLGRDGQLVQLARDTAAYVLDGLVVGGDIL